MNIRYVPWLTGLCLSLLSATPALSQATAARHDGRWNVRLTCPDTTDARGLVKGYEYGFTVTVAGGRVQGQFGAVGAPNSVAYEGTVADDGSLHIVATGTTGSSAYAVGRVAQGTPYQYTLAGRLSEADGQAVRTQLRPCKAVFTRP